MQYLLRSFGIVARSIYDRGEKIRFWSKHFLELTLWGLRDRCICRIVNYELVFSLLIGDVHESALYKWVNYRKGWRARWFVLEDGVLSYYKVHGPDKIGVGDGRENGIKVIGVESLRYIRKCNLGSGRGNGNFGNGFGLGKQWKPFGEVRLKVSSVQASKSDDKRLSIFSGTRTLHLRCESKEDRVSWIEALLVAKDKFPRLLTSNDLASSEEFIVSTEKLRARLMQDGMSETAVKDCESIMLGELF